MRSPAWLGFVIVLALGLAPVRAEAEKPSAPVTVTLTLTGGVVVLDATPTRDVAGVELRLAGRTARFGATRAGQHRRLEATITVPAAGLDVIGTARVGTGARVRSRGATLRLGPSAPAAKERPYRVVNVGGRGVAEVGE